MFVFIVASPRSGTTVLGKVLESHPDVAHWYEPYFIFDYKMDAGDNDQLKVSDINPEAEKFIRNEFELFLKKSKKKVLIEKTPTNSFKVDALYHLFPDAKFIHLVRDGRDVTHSIYREWNKRKAIALGWNIPRLMRLIYETLSRQHFWRNRFQAILYEIKTLQRLLPFLPKSKSSWENMVGWGPRFPGWQEQRKKLDDLEFAAMQWRECETAIQSSLLNIPGESVIEVRYEDLVTNSDKELGRVYEFAGLEYDKNDGFGKDLSPKRIGQFEANFSKEEQSKIMNVIGDMLDKLGYKV